MPIYRSPFGVVVLPGSDFELGDRVDDRPVRPHLDGCRNIALRSRRASRIAAEVSLR
jgi:hypothetical protein